VIAANTYRFNRTQFQRLTEVGILPENALIELIEGRLTVKFRKTPQHAFAVRNLYRVFSEQLSDRCAIDCQNPLALGEYSEPYPDSVLLRPEIKDELRFPLPEDVFLLVEVADASLDFDREDKLPLYAKAAVPEVWILNLLEGVIESYRSPQGSGYTSLQYFHRGESLSAQAFPEISFSVDELLPPANPH